MNSNTSATAAAKALSAALIACAPLPHGLGEHVHRSNNDIAGGLSHDRKRGTYWRPQRPANTKSTRRSISMSLNGEERFSFQFYDLICWAAGTPGRNRAGLFHRKFGSSFQGAPFLNSDAL
jgi:hypothetical protein